MKPQSCLSVDIISTLPSSIIETILCLVSIKEAARTSILSREWRYKWTKIPKLDFDDYIFKEPTDDPFSVESEMKIYIKRCKVLYAICRVLLMRQGPILEFTLSMEADRTCVEIDHILSYLSKNNTLKKLELKFFQDEDAVYWLPESVFSLHQLTDLYLSYCTIYVPPTFSGFHGLTSLHLKNVYMSTKTVLHLLSKCPLLKRFTLVINNELIDYEDKSTVMELFECLPMIEHLSVYSWITRSFVIDSVPQERLALLIHLKYFYMDFVSFAYADVLRFLAFLMRSSPNLEKITLDIFTGSVDDEKVFVIREAYSNIWLERLNELEIYGFSNLKAEVEFVKFMLAKSPKLKKVSICFEKAIDKNEESKMLSLLLRSPPASRLVEIIVTSLH